jgi:hypothetical protein
VEVDECGYKIGDVLVTDSKREDFSTVAPTARRLLIPGSPEKGECLSRAGATACPGVIVRHLESLP